MNDKERPTSWRKRLQRLIFRPDKSIQTTEQLHVALTEAKQNTVISHQSFDVIERVLKIANYKVSDIMTPRTKMISLDLEMPMQQVLEIIVDSAHSRFPVFSQEKIQGILLLKDIVHQIYREDTSMNLINYLRSPMLVPESKSLELLLTEFQVRKNHMAIVIDEYGDTSGLLTIEDVLEQIVGEIEDEHDFEHDDIIDAGDNRYLVKAGTLISDFNRYFESDFSADGVETISGYLLTKFERVPKHAEEIALDKFRFKVLEGDKRRLRLLEITVIATDEQISNQSS